MLCHNILCVFTLRVGSLDKILSFWPATEMLALDSQYYIGTVFVIRVVNICLVFCIMVIGMYKLHLALCPLVSGWHHQIQNSIVPPCFILHR